MAILSQTSTGRNHDLNMSKNCSKWTSNFVRPGQNPDRFWAWRMTSDGKDWQDRQTGRLKKTRPFYEHFLFSGSRCRSRFLWYKPAQKVKSTYEATFNRWKHPMVHRANPCKKGVQFLLHKWRVKRGIWIVFWSFIWSGSWNDLWQKV